MVALKQEELLDIAEKAVTLALEKGAHEAEAFTYKGIASSVRIERGQIARNSRIVDGGLGVRAVVNKAIGFSYTNILENKALFEEIVLKAISSAKGSKPDEDWHGLPAKKALSSVRNTYDRNIVELKSEDLVSVAFTMLDAVDRTDKRVLPVEGGAGASHLCKAIVNSNGIEAFDHGTYVECGLETIAKERDKVTPSCFEFNIERKYKIDPEWVGGEASRLAVSALKSKRIKTGKMKLIFNQFSLQQLLYHTLINAVKADYVQRNQSGFKDKIGEKVASEIVTIQDNGLFDGGIRTWKFDGEGVPQQNTRIIEKGTLENFIYDDYSAKKEGKESTGNASRAGYVSTPNVGASNFHVLSGKKSREELIDEVQEGLLVYYLQGAHSSNPASGEFSVVATPAWKIEKGEIVHAVKGAMLAGNVFHVLENVIELGNNERKVGQLVAPWVLVENVKVIGK